MRNIIITTLQLKLQLKLKLRLQQYNNTKHATIIIWVVLLSWMTEASAEKSSNQGPRFLGDSVVVYDKNLPHYLLHANCTMAHFVALFVENTNYRSSTA